MTHHSFFEWGHPWLAIRIYNPAQAGEARRMVRAGPPYCFFTKTRMLASGLGT